MRIGIIGGTFDPVHKGHLALAQKAYTYLELDKVIFVPAYIAPHKQTETTTAPDHRLAMLRLAIEGMDFCEISTYEFDKQEVVYTIDTLRHMREKFGTEAKLFFIVGSDFVYEYKTWKDYQQLFEYATFAVAARPGFKVRDLIEGMILLEGDFPCISSTDVRLIFKHGESALSCVPSKVFDYMREHGLYQ